MYSVARPPGAPLLDLDRLTRVPRTLDGRRLRTTLPVEKLLWLRVTSGINTYEMLDAAHSRGGENREEGHT